MAVLSFLIILISLLIYAMSSSIKHDGKKPVKRIKPRKYLDTNLLYHGTSMEVALEIFNTGLWLIGSSRPPAVWLTDKISEAEFYAEEKGAIVVVEVDPSIILTSHNKDCYYTFKIPDAQPGEEYLRIPALKPLAVFSAADRSIIKQK